ncbi:MAG: porin [Kiritimatiellia bacterium]
MGKMVLTGLMAGVMVAGIAGSVHAQASVTPANKGVERLQIRGRVQTQGAYVEADNDEGSDDYHTFEVRRVRMGMRGTLANNVRAQLEANLVPGSDLSMRSAFIQWREHKPAYIKLGFDKPLSSLEENTSSAEILTIERSLINGLVAAPGALNGLSLEGRHAVLVYGAGVYTDSSNSNASSEDPKYLFNAMAGLKLDALVGEGNELLLAGHYLNSDDPNGAVGGKFDDVIVVGGRLGLGSFGLLAEYFLGDNDGDEIKGFYVMPSYAINEKLQLVARFETAESDKARGIQAPSRYARRVASLADVLDDEGSAIARPSRGDDYQSLYLGLNYYIAGNNNKLMLGVESAELDNTDAGKLEMMTVSTAWRMLF